LLRGTSITTNTAILASGGTSVSGVSSDGVTQVLVRIPANQAGDSFTLTLINDQGQQSSSTSADGGLYALGGNPGSASSTMTVQAQNTSPPTAFAVYSAPSNYYRGTQDAAAAQRDITLQVNCSDANGSPSQQTANVLIVRPPVVLVHGLWSNPGQTWNNFSPASPQNQSLWNNALSKRYVDYSTPVSGITATTPSYLPALTTVSGSALGLAYNAPYVLSQVQAAVNDLENHYNVAAVQADVVAHSMGGNISRVMATLPNFTNPNNYGAGPVHKLITIGTPHTGTPLADALLPNSSSDPNACVRKALQLAADDVSLQTVTIGGNVANGAVGDLQFPQLLYGTTQTFPIAYIAGQTNTSNLALLNVPSEVVVDGIPVPTESQVLHTICGTLGGDPLAQSLTTNGWNFGAFTGSPNDGIVPVVSQLNNTNNAGALVFIGFIHSPGMETLDFVGPSEVDSASGIPDEVINLLDEATNGSDFNQ